MALDLSSLHFKTVYIHTELFTFKAQFELTLHSQPLAVMKTVTFCQHAKIDENIRSKKILKVDHRNSE